jgi:3,4-dihydroxy 2-butanone 4-phosphate synthase / GTP cyclohydrolase II
MSNLTTALSQFKDGKFLIVTDDKNREDEGDLILLAQSATTEQIAFMVRYTSGVICAAMESATAKRLKLPPMVKRNEDNHSTAFTVSVDLIKDRTTGISAQERANTLRALGSSNSVAADFARPGHIFPLIAVDGGLQERAGHTEAGVALCQLTDTNPVAVICELVNDDGSMMRGAQLAEFAKAHQIEIISIERLREIAPVVNKASKPGFTWAKLPLNNDLWQITTFTSNFGTEHAILKFGELTAKPLVRIHSECLTGDVFGSLRCDCGDQLLQSIELIKEQGSGLIIYLRDHEGRGIGLAQKIAAYELQDKGENTVQANISLGHAVDERSYQDAVLILQALEIKEIDLLSNNPEKFSQLIKSGIKVNQLPIQTAANSHNQNYLKSKKEILNHALGDI